MENTLLGVVTPGNQVMPLLQNGLQLVEESYGKLERLGVATFWEGRTQCLENQGNLQVLSTFETPAHLEPVQYLFMSKEIKAKTTI